MNLNTFELRSKNYFFTYSDCESLHETILARIRRGFSEIGESVIKFVVARELHADGLRHHVHCFVEIAKVLRRRVASDHFNEGSHHPNISGVRSCRRVIKYVVKDGNYITNDEEMVKEAIGKWGITKKDIGQKLIDGGDLCKIVKDNPQLIFGYSRLKSDIDAWQSDNSKIQPGKRPVGIWLGGKSGVGKSWFARNRVPELLGQRVYCQPNNVRFSPGWDGQRIWLCEDVDRSWHDSCEGFKIRADEYEWVGESKGGHFKVRCVLFIITSNLTLEEYLSECKILDDYSTRLPWLRRFLEFYITDRNEFDNVLEELRKIAIENGDLTEEVSCEPINMINSI